MSDADLNVIVTMAERRNHQVGGVKKSELFKEANRTGASLSINLYFSLVIRMGSRGRKSTQSLAVATIGPVEIVQRPDTPL